MTALDHRAAVECGEASAAARPTPCECCGLETGCGKAYAARAGVDVKATDQRLAAWVASDADEDIDDGYAVGTHPADLQLHTDDFYDYDTRARFKAEKTSHWRPE